MTPSCRSCGQPLPARRTIAAYVRENEGASPLLIASETGLDYAVVRKMVRRMTAAGQLTTPERGAYWPPEGSPS